MPLRQFVAQKLSDTAIVTTTELAVVTSPPVSTRDSGEAIVIEGYVTVTAGTGATAITPTIRRGSGITGAIVGEQHAVTVTAGNVVALSVNVEDVPGEVAGQVYTLTVAQTGASANGTATEGIIEIVVGDSD